MRKIPTSWVLAHGVEFCAHSGVATWLNYPVNKAWLNGKSKRYLARAFGTRKFGHSTQNYSHPLYFDKSQKYLHSDE